MLTHFPQPVKGSFKVVKNSPLSSPSSFYNTGKVEEWIIVDYFNTDDSLMMKTLFEDGRSAGVSIHKAVMKAIEASTTLDPKMENVGNHNYIVMNGEKYKCINITNTDDRFSIREVHMRKSDNQGKNRINLGQFKYDGNIILAHFDFSTERFTVYWPELAKDIDDKCDVITF